MTLSPSAEKLNEWLGPIAGPEVYAYLTETTKSDGSLRWPNAEQDILDTVVPRFHSPPPSGRDDIFFDIGSVDHFVSFCRLLPHVKGKFAKDFQRLELDFWQIIFICAPLFGWRVDNGTEFGIRLYRILYEETAKKSGKSTFAAALGLYLLVADDEPGAEVVCAAGDKEQARAVFSVAKAMAERSKPIRSRVRPLKDQISYLDTNSWFKVVSADGKLKAGLNLHGAIIDELLVQKSRTLVDNLENATAAREQPLVAYVTTAGIDDPGSIYTEKRNYAQKVAEGELLDEVWLVAIWTLDEGDDWRDEAVWFKSNPGLGKSVSLEYLRSKCRQAIASPASQNTFLRDHLNVRTGQAVRWLDMHFWDKSGVHWVTPHLDLLRGSIAYAGLDLAFTSDLAAFSVIIPEMVPDPNDREEMIESLCWFVWAWTPEDTIPEREVRDQAPYQQWVDDGWLIATPGNVINYDFIEQEVFRIMDDFELHRLEFDRYGARQLVQHLKDGGIPVFEVGQGFVSMSPPMKELERQILQARVRHSNNPVLRWAVQSLAVKMDPAGNIKPDRDASTGRIDPFVAGIMAIDGWSRENVGVSFYDQGADGESDVA